MNKRWKRCFQVAVGGLSVLLFLFVLNGVYLTSGVTGEHGTVLNPTAEQPRKDTAEVRVMAFNIAKCFVMTGPVTFESEEVVEERLYRISSIIR